MVSATFPYKCLMIVVSIKAPNNAVVKNASSIARKKGNWKTVVTKYVTYAPIMINSPWAMLTTSINPKMITNPKAVINSMAETLSPLIPCEMKSSIRQRSFLPP